VCYVCNTSIPAVRCWSSLASSESVSASKWLREFLIQYWANRADLSGIEADGDGAIQKNARDQVVAVLTALRMKYGENIHGEAKGNFEVDFLGDETAFVIV
jgi:hypothetical protein